MHHQSLDITEEQADNLRKLGNYLVKNDLRLGFDMEAYRNRCGTAGCAVGHGPNAGVEKLDGEDWDEYSYRVFVDCLPGPRWHMWEWLFSWEWYRICNDPVLTGHRILWTLQYGVPKDWAEQMAGDAPLCFVPNAQTH